MLTLAVYQLKNTLIRRSSAPPPEIHAPVETFEKSNPVDEPDGPPD